MSDFDMETNDIRKHCANGKCETLAMFSIGNPRTHGHWTLYTTINGNVYATRITSILANELISAGFAEEG